jgi:alpha-1,2-mannosyltransferase
MLSRRWVAAAGVLAAGSVGGWVLLVALHPQTYWHQTDAIVYRDAGLAVRDDPGTLYARTFGQAGLPFSYPPFAALIFAVLSPLRFAGWQVLLTAAGIAALFVAAWAATRLTGKANPAGALVIGAVGMWLEPVDLTLHFGQINLVLMAVILVDLALPEHSRWKGVGIGLAAAVKLTPLIFVGYLLVTRRVRPAVTALVTFVAAAGVGFAVLGRDSAAYWTGRFARPGDDPTRLVNQSLNGLVLRAHGGTLLWLVAAAVVAAVGLTAAALAARRGHELLGVCLCAATGLLISPTSWTHHWVWVVPALALPGRAAVGVIFGWWPTRLGPHGAVDPGIAPHPTGLLRYTPHDDGAELHWTAWQTLYGNVYTLAALAFVAVSAGYLLSRSRRR